MIRNQIYKLKDFKPGDRFHIVGNKNKRGEVLKQVHEDKVVVSVYPIKTQVMYDGQQFTSLLNPDKEVVYLRSKEN